MRFRTKIVLCTVLLLALSFGIGGNLLLSLSFSSVLEQEENSAFQSYEMVLSTLSLVNNVSDQTSENDVVEVLRQMEERGGDWSDLRITDQQDTLYQSDYQFTALLLDQRDATDQSTGVSQLFAYGDKHYLQITSQFLLGENTYYLDGLYDLSSPWQQRERQQGIYFSIFWGVVLLGGLLAWILATLLTRPMTQLSRASRALAEGKLDSRSQIKGSDEVADLSRDFDRMADSIQNYIAQLQDSMRRQDEFMGSFAHELKTPMTSIIGYADLLRSRSLAPEDAREAANYIFREGSRLEHLSLKLLDLLVLGKDDFTLVDTDLNRLAKDVEEVIRPVLEKKQVDFQVSCQPGQCLMEPELVKSLILNLLDNGKKALDGGGELTLSIQPTEDGCEIQVADTGRGIPEEEIRKLTEAFYRVDKSRSRAQGGAGLGLSLCNEIVRIHRGELIFHSRVGQGTLVTVLLRGGRT